MTNFYVDVDYPGATPDAVFKATFDSDGILDSEFVWSGKLNDWKPTNAIHRFLVEGDMRIEPITEDQARTYLPIHAFTTDRDEVKTFIKFLSKSPKRPFEFVHVPEIYGEVLNKFVKAGDLDSARMYAERYLA